MTGPTVPMTLPRTLLVVAALVLLSPAAGADTLPQGALPRVGRINVVGNAGLSTGRILGAMTLAKKRLFILPRAFDDLDLDNDLRHVTDLYRSSGYIHAEVTADSIARRGNAVDITVAVREETRLILRSVAVEGPTGRVDARELAALIRMKAGRPLNLAEVNEARGRILRRLAEDGHAFVELRQVLVEHGDQADLIFRVASGPAVTLGNVRVVGNQDVSAEAIRREVDLPTGALLRRRELLRIQRALTNRDWFRTVSVAPVRSTESLALPEATTTLPADLSVVVEEKPPRWIAARVGYGTADLFHGGLEWGHRNLNGEGRRIALEGSASATRVTGGATLSEPWPIAAVSTGRLSARVTDEIRQAFTEHKEAVLVGAAVPLGDYTTSDFSIEAARTTIRKTLAGTLGEISGDLDRDRYQALTTAGLVERNTYDDRSFPRSGSHGRLRAEVTLLDLEAWKVEASVGRAQSMHENLVAAGAIGAGLVRGFGRTREVPSTIRFFLGGPDSIRGFRKDEVGPVDAFGQPTGGAFYILAQGELRVFPTDKGHAAVFLDIGQVVRRVGDLDVEDFVASPGVGVRYHTPFGPIRLDYAWPYANSHFGAGRINFAVGYAF